MEHERLRIAMVTAHTARTGQHVHIAGLSAALAVRGHDVTVYTRRDGSRSPRREHTNGYGVVRVSAGPALRMDEDEIVPHLGRFADFLSQEWQDNPPDLVHSHHWTSGLVSELGGRRKTPVVQTYHGLGGCAKRLRGERIVGREATRVAATSFDEVFTLIRMGVDRGRISVVPTGVDVRMFTPHGRIAERGALRRIIAVGTPAPGKGFDDLVVALSQVDDTEVLTVGGPNKRRIGQGSEVRRLLAFAACLGVAERVVFTGGVSREEMPALLRSADAVVCAPLYEPVGGLADTIVDGVTGMHVPPGRPRHLAKVLRGLLGDDTRRQEFGVAGRDRVCARYSWDRIAADTVRAYQRASGWPLPPLSAAPRELP